MDGSEQSGCPAGRPLSEPCTGLDTGGGGRIGGNVNASGAGAAIFGGRFKKLEVVNIFVGWSLERQPRPDSRAIGMMAGLLLLLIWAGAHTESLIQFSAKERAIETTAEHNKVLAAAHARIVLNLLKDYAERLQRMSGDPALQAILLRYVRAEKVTFPSEALAKYARDLNVDVLFFENTDGFLRGRSKEPSDPRIIERSYTFRDYFKCARERHLIGSHTACLSRVYAGDPRGNGYELKYSLSIPVYDVNGIWIGILGAQRNIALNTVDIITATRVTRDQRVSLLGPTDTLPAHLMHRRNGGCVRLQPPGAIPKSGVEEYQSARSDLVVLHQKGLATNQLCRLSRLNSELQSEFIRDLDPDRQFEHRNVEPARHDNYVDPATGTLGIASSAPVGSTGYGIVVYTPKELIYQEEDYLTRGLKTLKYIFGVAVLWVLAVVLRMLVAALRQRDAKDG